MEQFRVVLVVQVEWSAARATDRLSGEAVRGGEHPVTPGRAAPPSRPRARHYHLSLAHPSTTLHPHMHARARQGQGFHSRLIPPPPLSSAPAVPRCVYAHGVYTITLCLRIAHSFHPILTLSPPFPSGARYVYAHGGLVQEALKNTIAGNLEGQHGMDDNQKVRATRGVVRLPGWGTSARERCSAEGPSCGRVRNVERGVGTWARWPGDSGFRYSQTGTLRQTHWQHGNA